MSQTVISIGMCSDILLEGQIKEMLSEKKDSANALYNEYEPYIRKLCSYKLKSIPDKIDDSVQEIFMALIEAINNGAEIKNPKAWLTVVANNIIKDIYEEKSRDKKKVSDLTLHTPGYILIDEEENRCLLLEEETLEKYRDLIIDKLNNEEQKLLYDKYTLKKSAITMAAERNTTANNIYQKFSRLKKKIKILIYETISD